MPTSADSAQERSRHSSTSAASSTQPLPESFDRRHVSQARPYTLFSLPSTIKQLFARFPLQTLPSNPLPLRITERKGQNTLFVFSASDEAAKNGEPSINPGCLKWQTYLLALGVELSLANSNNHASLEGALPFLIDAKGKVEGTGGLKAWADAAAAASIRNDEQVKEEEKVGSPTGDSEDVRLRTEAYLALIEQRIRPAWVSSTTGRICGRVGALTVDYSYLLFI